MKPRPTVARAVALLRGSATPLTLLTLACLSGPLGRVQAVQPRQLNALAMIESGANDRARGRGGEVSRYQIMPYVWAHYTASRAYANPSVSRRVAERIFSDRENQFKKATGRNPASTELYLLWACPNKFRAVRYQYQRITVRTRRTAERFAALAGP